MLGAGHDPRYLICDDASSFSNLQGTTIVDY